MKELYTDVFDYIVRQSTAYEKPIQTGSKTWSMKDHIERSTLYRDSDIVGVKGKFTPIKNITRPILNLQYRTEDLDVKDVQIYIDDETKYHLSFLVKKYHDDVFVQENDIDTFFDELNQSRIDYGGGLTKALAVGRETVPLSSIVFCDQRDMLSRPIGLKHSYSPDELIEMEKLGWGKTENGATATVRELITLAREDQKENVSEGDIEVIEVHGNLPKRFADRRDDSGEYESRLFICAFYTKMNSKEKNGVILFTKPEPTSPFKLIKRDPIYGRALGFGGAEELFEDQLWTNYAQIRKLQMMDSASKTILGATGAGSTSIANMNKIDDLDNNEILDLGDGDLKQIDTFPRNFQLFDNFVEELGIHAKEMGAAQDPLQGSESPSGTPFAALQAQIQQGLGLHDYRRGIFAKHIEEIYKEDYIPMIIKKITQGTKFLSELSLGELQYVEEKMTDRAANDFVKEKILNGDVITREEVDAFKETFAEDFRKKGEKQFIEILKGEFKNVKLAVKVSVAGKSKNLGKATDVLVNIFRFAFSNPQGFGMTMQIPGMAAGFNQILEFAGLNPVNFAGIEKLAQPQPQPQQAAPVKTPPELPTTV